MNVKINETAEQAHDIAMYEFKVHELLEQLMDTTGEDEFDKDVAPLQMFLIKRLRKVLQPVVDIKQFETPECLSLNDTDCPV
jgi:hypothetical protein